MTSTVDMNEQAVFQSDQDAQLIDLMKSRAATYGLLARLYRVEVDEALLGELQHMRFPVATGSSDVDRGFRMLYDYLRGVWQDSVTELAIDYVRTFIGHGVNGYSAAYPFESVYTNERRLMMQEARAEVLATFREHMLKRGAWNEGEDHIALELEFMQRMSLRIAEALESGDDERTVSLLKTQRGFAHEHLLNWMPMLVADMMKFSKTKFYQGLAVLSMGYVKEDAALVEELLASAGEEK